MKLLFFSSLLFIYGLTAVSQNFLSPEEALRIGLENNFGILLVRNEKAVAQNNTNPGNAGMLPRINLSSNRNLSVNDSRQEFLTGQVNQRNDARSDVFGYGAQLNWTIFDGFRMFRRYDHLRTMEKKAEMQEFLAVEQTILSIYNQYYKLVFLEKRLQYQQQSLKLSNERVRLAQTRLQSGSGSRLEFLQATVDRNNDSAAVYEIQNQIIGARMQLNHTLGRKPETPFMVTDTFSLKNLPSDSILLQKLEQNNTMLAITKQDQRMAQLSLNELRSRLFPELSANLGYNYLNQQSEAGFLLINNSSGFTYGLSASWSLFNGLNTRREISNSRLAIESTRIRTEALENELRSNLLTAINQYRNKLTQLELEKHNAHVADESLYNAVQRYRIGDLSGLEYRETIRNQLNIKLKLLQTLLDAVVLETNIRQLTGLLTQETFN